MGDFLRKMILQERKNKDTNAQINALVYLRVSTNRQAAKEFSSIDAQRKMVDEYASRNPKICIVGEYSDAKSAKDTNRRGFREMLAHIERGGIDAVISYKNDRVCRNKANFAELKQFLNEHNVRLIYSNDFSSDGSPTGDFAEDITVNLSEMERRKISERTAHKYLQNLKRGFRSGGVAPFGYKTGRTPCSIEIDSANAEIVRKIYSEFLSGKKPSEISAHLTKRYGQIPLRKTRSGRQLGGKPFNENFVRKVLANPMYSGYNYISLGAENSRPKYELFKGVHSPIVKKSEWDKVQGSLYCVPKQRKSVPIISSDEYLLKGYLRCVCGSMMTAAYTLRKGRKYPYYICSRRNKEHSACECKEGGIALSVLEGVVFSAIGYFMREKLSAVSRNGEYREELERKIAALRTARERLRKKIASANDEYLSCSDELMKAHFKESLRMLVEEERNLERKLGDTVEEQKLLSAADTANQSRTVSANIRDMDLLQSNLTPEEKRTILENAIERLVISSVSHKSRFCREMSLKVFPTHELNGVIPKCDLRFIVDTSRGKSLWKIISPFEMPCSALMETKKEPKTKTARHFICDVFDWRREIETRKITATQFCAEHGIKKSLFSLKYGLLKKLSPKVVEFLAKTGLPEIPQRMSYRKTSELAKLAQSEQMAELRRVCGNLNVSA